MERAEWLKQMRSMTEEMYDRFSPLYWVSWGFSPNETHLEYLQKFLARVVPDGAVLSAGCGAGRFDGLLLDAGHPVVGIDQSAGMLARAKEHFPQVRYEKMGFQEMQFREEFDGLICMDAMEHVCPEDYPRALRKFQEALKPGGVLYFTAEPEDTEEAQAAVASYERVKARGLPVVPGEGVEGIYEAYEQMMALQPITPELLVPDEVADRSVYHYYPPLEQVRAWIDQAGLVIEEEGAGSELHHFVARKKKE
jgi:2-polyprenyl-3-methyl-5-hydroxy-6-metoxy-1,4-benzoquinol methylase